MANLGRQESDKAEQPATKSVRRARGNEEFRAKLKADREKRNEALKELQLKRSAGVATSKTKGLSGPIRQKGVVTIPQQIREELHLEEGDQVMFSVRDGSIVITPAAVVPRDQAWFWSPAWQAMEAEAEAEIAAGGGETYASGEDFIEGLKAA